MRLITGTQAKWSNPRHCLAVCLNLTESIAALRYPPPLVNEAAGLSQVTAHQPDNAAMFVVRLEYMVVSFIFKPSPPFPNMHSRILLRSDSPSHQSQHQASKPYGRSQSQVSHLALVSCHLARTHLPAVLSFSSPAPRAPAAHRLSIQRALLPAALPTTQPTHPLHQWIPHASRLPPVPPSRAATASSTAVAPQVRGHPPTHWHPMITTCLRTRQLMARGIPPRSRRSGPGGARTSCSFITTARVAQNKSNPPAAAATIAASAGQQRCRLCHG